MDKEKKPSAIRSEWEKLRKMPKKDIPWYLWEYYKFPFFGILIAIVVIVSVTRTVIENSKPVLVNAVFVNAPMKDDANVDGLEKKLTRYMGKTTAATNMNLRTGLLIDFTGRTDPRVTESSKQIILVDIMAGKLDVMVTTKDVLSGYSTGEDPFLVPVKEALKDHPDLLKKYESRLYIPEGTKEAYGINLEGCTALKDAGFYFPRTLYFAFGAGSKRRENAVKMLQFLLP